MGLKAINGRVVISVDMEKKNFHTFSNGTVIRLERKYDNFNKRYTQPINATVIDSENIPNGVDVLVQHNATHPVHEIFNYKTLSGDDIASDIRYFSIPEHDCYAWFDGGEWQPTTGFVFGLRIFQPYKGTLSGIAPKLIKDVLYITTGEYSNQVVHTLKSSDYELIFQGISGKEERIIRCRHFEVEGHHREEIICTNDELTNKVQSGEYLIGLNTTDAKRIKRTNSL